VVEEPDDEPFCRVGEGLDLVGEPAADLASVMGRKGIARLRSHVIF
jgi:hypothetical protein